ncbi:MAG: AMMECR1 domain-containing protein [Desulfobacteraceae bacterium 4572_89]|nr:MAG: AMMECR1 domain-containing protein [Desulfobacteraceae bacterium 4572_89]
MTTVISKKESLALLKLAREYIAGEFGGKSPDIKGISKEISRDVLRQKRGVFVTLHKKGELRGCIGNIEPVKTLENGIRENAIYAAFKDSRFTPLTIDELPRIDIEISILTLPEKMIYKNIQNLVSNLVPGVDGVIIEKDHHRATFLPQVWDQLPEPEAFLSQLCTKAGLPAREWEKGTLTLHTYQVVSFGETDKI